MNTEREDRIKIKNVFYNWLVWFVTDLSIKQLPADRSYKAKDGEGLYLSMEASWSAYVRKASYAGLFV